MSRRVWLSLLVGIGMIAGCASGSDGPSSRSVARVHANATVRSVVYMEAPNPTPAAVRTPVAANASGAVATNVKPVARSTKRENLRTKQRARSEPFAPTPVATSEPPRSAIRAYRYTYTVELDSGDFRTFGFADDQQLRVGDRVVVSDSGVAAVPK